MDAKEPIARGQSAIPLLGQQTAAIVVTEFWCVAMWEVKDVYGRTRIVHEDIPGDPIITSTFFVGEYVFAVTTHAEQPSVRKRG